MDENKVLATVAGVEITDRDLDGFIKSMPQEQQRYASHPQFREHALEQMVSIHLFAADGRDRNLEETEDFKRILEAAKRDILAQIVMAEFMASVRLEEEEVKAFYEANLDKFQRDASVNAKHILVDSEEKAKEIMAMIEAGEKEFEAAAAEFSTCPSKERGGDLGAFSRGQMVPEFEDAAFDAEIGKVVGPVKTQFGYHIIKVEAKNDAGARPYEEVKHQIMQNLVVEKQQRLYAEKVEELKGKYC